MKQMTKRLYKTRAYKKRITQRRKLKHRQQKKITKKTKRTIHTGGATPIILNRGLVVTTIDDNNRANQPNKVETPNVFSSELSKGGMFGLGSSYKLKIVIDIGKYRYDTHKLIVDLVREVFEFKGNFPFTIGGLVDYKKVSETVKKWNNNRWYLHSRCDRPQRLLMDINNSNPTQPCVVEFGFKFDKGKVTCHSIKYTVIEEKKTFCHDIQVKELYVSLPVYSVIEDNKLDYPIDTDITEEQLKRKINQNPTGDNFNVLLLDGNTYYGFGDLNVREDVKDKLAKLDAKDNAEIAEAAAAKERFANMTPEQKNAFNAE